MNPTDHIGRTSNQWVNRCEDDEVVDEVAYPPAQPVSAWSVKTPTTVRHRRRTRPGWRVVFLLLVAVGVEYGLLMGFIAGLEAIAGTR